MQRPGRLMSDKVTKLDCPNADGSLRPVNAHDRQGVAVALDQCDVCGGVWFDRFELFRVDKAEAGGLDKLDKNRLRYPLGAHEKPLCPRCGRPLQAFHDANIPGNIQLLFCGGCEGFWVNHGALAGYAHYREAGHKRPDPARAADYEKLAGQYEKMLKTQSDKGYWQGIADFGKALGDPRDPITGLSLESASPSELERIDRAQDVFFTVLGTAARLLFSWL